MLQESRLTTFLNKRKWVLIVLFVFMCIFFAGTIVAAELRGFENMDVRFSFSIGGEICAMAVAIMMTVSILPAYKRQSGYIRVFVTLLAIGSMALFLDSIQMIIDGREHLAWANKITAILVFDSEILFIYFFWLYIKYALNIEGKSMQIADIVLSALFLVFLLLPWLNMFFPFYFEILPNGTYTRVTTFWIHRSYIVLVAVLAIVALILSKESKKTKIVILVFMAIPLITIGAGGFRYGVSVLYSSMMVSLVLIYAFIFSDNEKDLYSTNKELGIATNIQKQMLPSIFPAFPERKEFDIYASMNPAKEVGGDFYDFFLVDDNHLALVMADVSDKGVPAALFMMASKIMVQNYTLLGKSPAEVLEAVNNQICQNNQEYMFVTVWLGILDLKTGVLTAANAGHEKPAIKAPNGQFELYKDKGGFVVGWYKDTKYRQYELKLEKGTKIFLYTDGVPEASSTTGQFTRGRMIETLNKYGDLNPQEIIENIKNDIDSFVGNADQFDDITMMCIEFKGYSGVNYQIEANLDLVDSMIDPIVSALEDFKTDPKIIYHVTLALEEILVNICKYAYDEKGTIDISYEIDKKLKQLKVTIKDKGKAFNPLEKEDPDLSASIAERKIGGLGIYLTKRVVDDIKYQRIDDTNILEFVKKL